MRNVKVILHVLFILWAGHAFAQNFPARVTPILSPPYSPFLTDYTDPGSDKLTLQLLLTDVTISEYRCKLRLTIEGVNITIQTSPAYVPPPLVLQGGVPELLYGSDLADYFRLENLVYKGITKNEIEKNGNKLPEGIYAFTFEILDYNRNTVISNKGSATAWMLLNDPPFINQPFNNSKLKPLDPQNIVFQWTPRHRGSPNAAFSTEYDVKLVEIWPAGRNPYDAINTARPIFETTTDATMVVYGPAETPLVLGREYALQVRAKDTGGKDLFKNNGYSEVVRFVYGDECPTPLGVVSDDVSTMTARLAWQSNALNSRYVVRYREQKSGAEWFEDSVTPSYVKIQSLRPGVTYEYQVAGECLSYQSEFTPLKTLTTVTEDPHAFVCGQSTPLPPPDGSGPRPALLVNDVIKAGGFSIIVTKASGSNGRFTGEGLAVIPWFNNASIRVTFENISVNQSRQLTGGFINSVWDKDSKLLLKQEVAVAGDKAPSSTFKSDVATVEADSLVELKGAIVSVTHDADSNVVVVTNEGQTVTLKKGTSYAVADEIGNGYIVKPNGDIEKTTAKDAALAAERGERQYSKDPNLSVRFTSSAQGKYGFDEMREGTLPQHYQQTDNGKYVAWKALATNKTESIKVVSEGTADLSKVKFERVGIVDEQLTLSSSNELSLLGDGNAVNEELLATYSVSDTAGKQILGKVNLISYDGLTKRLVLVKVNATTFTASTATVQSQLNEIYGQAVVNWEVNGSVQSLRVDAVDENKLDDGGSGLLSNYTADMKAVLNAYHSTNQFAVDTYYLFLVSGSKSDTLSGFMPRGKQAGFIFTKAHLSTNELVRTIAHELGHGAFNLSHTFSEFPAITKGSSDNLMDYSMGTKLNKYQWDYIHNPQRVIGLFEDDEDAAAGVFDSFYCTPDKTLAFKWTTPKNGTRTFLTPSGKPIRFSDTAILTDLFFGGFTCGGETSPDIPSVSQQTLSGFTLEGVTYIAVIRRVPILGASFIGYALMKPSMTFHPEDVAKYTYYNQGKTNWESSIAVSIPVNRLESTQECMMALTSIDFDDNDLLEDLPCKEFSIDIALDKLKKANLAVLTHATWVKVMEKPEYFWQRDTRFYVAEPRQYSNAWWLGQIWGEMKGPHYPVDNLGRIELNSFMIEEEAFVGRSVVISSKALRGISKLQRVKPIADKFLSLLVLCGLMEQTVDILMDGSDVTEVGDAAKLGEIEQVRLIADVVQLRNDILEALATDTMNEDVLGEVLHMLHYVNEALKQAFAADSKFPLYLVDTKTIEVQPLPVWTIDPQIDELANEGPTITSDPNLEELIEIVHNPEFNPRRYYDIDKDDEENHSVYVTIRDVKFKEARASLMPPPSPVTQPLFYVGITTEEDTGERYKNQQSELVFLNLEDVDKFLTKRTARGIEQVLIMLNNRGSSFPQNSRTLDNQRNSTDVRREEYLIRLFLGILHLQSVHPDWVTFYNRPPKEIELRLRNSKRWLPVYSPQQ